MAKVDVIFNNTCPICSREVEAYRRRAERTDAPIAFYGISTAQDLVPAMTEDQAARRFHVLRDGQLLSGVDAFRALWSELPGWRWLARVVGLPGIRQIAEFGYDWIAAPVLYGLHRRRRRG